MPKPAIFIWPLLSISPRCSWPKSSGPNPALQDPCKAGMVERANGAITIGRSAATSGCLGQVVLFMLAGMPRRWDIDLWPWQHQRDRGCFEIGNHYRYHGKAKHPTAPLNHQCNRSHPRHKPRTLCHPGVIAGQAAKLRPCYKPAERIATDRRGHPLRLGAHHCRIEQH